MHCLKLFNRGTLFLLTVYLRGGFSVRLSLFNLDQSQRATLGEFRSIIQKYHPRELHLQDDAYLLTFLAVKNFNLQKAVDYISENLVWRKATRIDSILEEDWSDYDQRFPYNISNITKDFRPILYLPYGQWDISSEIDSGNYAKLVRYVSAKILEDADRKVRSSRENPNVAQFDIVINLDGFTMEKQGYSRCLQMSQEVFQKSEAHYSGAVDNTYFVNAPPAFVNVFLFSARAFMEEISWKSIRFLGAGDAYEW